MIYAYNSQITTINRSKINLGLSMNMLLGIMDNIFTYNGNPQRLRVRIDSLEKRDLDKIKNRSILII